MIRHMAPSRRKCLLCPLILPLVFSAGCGLIGKKDYSRPLPPGTHALRKITRSEDLPDLKAAWQSVDESLAMALDYSIDWLANPARKQYFPVSGITYDKAMASVKRFRELVKVSFTADEFQNKILSEFDVYISVGCDDRGTVLYTGYFSPIFEASWEKTPAFQHPLYRRPEDLVTDWSSGKTLGRQQGDKVVPYATRKEIETGQSLDGTELVWLKDPLSVYLIHVNGSAKLRMTGARPGQANAATGNKTIYIGYAGNNGHPYTSIGKCLIDDRRIPADKMSFFTIRAFFRKHPELLTRYTHQNDRFVFFQQYTSEDWPAGSLGFKVTPFRTVATDKSVFPRGCATLAVTTLTAEKTGEKAKPFSQIMVDQDTGGAIRAAGRADLYMGTGDEAEKRAGRQRAEGKLYYFFLK